MNQPKNDQQKEQAQKRRNQIIFVICSFSALVVVGLIAFFALTKIKSQRLSDVLSQDQFEGTAEISSQLQGECQSSATKISKLKDIAAAEQEYRQNAENCKDVYFAIEGESPFRKEGMYADLVVDIAKELAKTDKTKAVDLLKFAQGIKSWDFYLGPVSCDSQHVLDAYIETYSLAADKTCLQASDMKSKISQNIASKNFDFLSKMVAENEVVWLGMPESDVGCPEKISSITQIIQKLTSGSISLDEIPAELNENNQINVNIKLSDKENVTLIFATHENCLKLSSVLVPNLEVSE